MTAGPVDAPSSEKLSAGVRTYHGQRLRNRIFGAVMEAFEIEEAAGRITMQHMADALEHQPQQIAQRLSGSSYWAVDTISDLLLAMGAELDVRVVFFRDIDEPSSDEATQ